MATPTLADIVREVTGELRAQVGGWLPEDVERALRAIAQCRTAAFGGHLYACTACGCEVPVYNSCRDRHCPQCQARATREWLEARMDDLLPVPYFHLVFTIPRELHPFVRFAPRTLYGILFRAAWQALRDVAAVPRHLGAEPGAMAVLHTWTQRLQFHPHVHMVVPGGGLDEANHWRPSKPRFLVPVEVLSRRFASCFLDRLERLIARQALRLPDDMDRNPSLLRTTLHQARSRRWVVYAKRPFGGPHHVLRYLARYTHRVAISNARIVAFDGETVTFKVKKRSADSSWRTASLPAIEFLRRFAQHILPRGFVRIRFYGLLANRKRREALARCREELGMREVESAIEEATQSAQVEALLTCPHCASTSLELLEALPRHPRPNPRAPP